MIQKPIPLFYPLQLVLLSVGSLDVGIFQHGNRAAAPVGQIFAAKRGALDLLGLCEHTFARETCQLADAVHLALFHR